MLALFHSVKICLPPVCFDVPFFILSYYESGNVIVSIAFIILNLNNIIERKGIQFDRKIPKKRTNTAKKW